MSEDDWNFDNVPDNQLVACCYWEYARESEFICDTLKRYRDWLLAGSKWGDGFIKLNKNLERIFSIGHSSDVFVRGCVFKPDRVSQSHNPKEPDYSHPYAPPITGNFPAPWQLLSQPERECRAHIKTDLETFNIVPIKMSHWSWAKEIARECQREADAQYEQRKEWERKYLKKDAHGILGMVADAPVAPEFIQIRPRTRWGAGETLMVDIFWNHFTNEEIVSHFRKWVKVARPKETPIPSGRGHKPGDWRAKLTRLAVMRLLSRFTALQLVADNSFPEIWETKQFSGRKWGDVTKWHDARREAAKIFHTLFPFLPKEEKPLSWNRPAPAK